MFGTMFVGFALIAELRAGVIERMRVTPVSRLALLLGRCARDMLSLLVQSAILVALALPFGLDVRVGDLALDVRDAGPDRAAVLRFSYGVALVVRSEDALAPLLNSVTIPLLLLSGILLPLTLGPAWLQAIATWNPFSWSSTPPAPCSPATRAIPHVWKALVIVTVLAALASVWSARRFATSVR
jgi:ABC-2 type transport system permease protein